MKTAYILVGVPGSGKSTWIKNQDWTQDCAIISTDYHVENYALSQNKTYSEVFEGYMPTAIDMMTNDVTIARNNGLNIIWDQTSTTINSRRKKFKMLPDYRHIAVVFETPSPTELTKRLNSRPGKNIPLHVIDSMIKNFDYPTNHEGYDEIWFVTNK